MLHIEAPFPLKHPASLQVLSDSQLLFWCRISLHII